MTASDNLGITFLEAGQAQKHVTVNDGLRALDAVVQLSVADKDLTAPPGSTPAAGTRYIVASTATGAWSGQENNIAAYQDGAWAFYTPQAGWEAFVEDEGYFYIFDGTSWLAGFCISPKQAYTGHRILEEATTLSGATTSTAIQIPDKGICIGVSCRVTTEVTGATSFDIGDGSTANLFGDDIGLTVDTTNNGVIDPTAYYAATSIVFTANGSNFTGGVVRTAIHYMTINAPTS